MPIPHKPKTQRQRRMPTGIGLEISEAAYSTFLAVCQVAYNAVNRAFPRDEREKVPKIGYLHADAIKQIKSFLTHHKTVVRDDIIPLAILKKEKAAYDFFASDFYLEERTKRFEDRPTQEFRALVITNLDYLYMRLRDYAGMWLPEDQVEGYLKALESTYETERPKLLEFLSVYRATPALKPIDIAAEHL